LSVELASGAKRDLRRLDKQTRYRIFDALRSLAKHAPNLDIKTLKGTQSALRLRVGECRVLYRRVGETWWIERIVDRPDLDRALPTLGY
jgi:mRNA-degrading endonuclease RelE of RelBE toxin-antitoxin system